MPTPAELDYHSTRSLFRAPPSHARAGIPYLALVLVALELIPSVTILWSLPPPAGDDSGTSSSTGSASQPRSRSENFRASQERESGTSSKSEVSRFI